jgi:hypothetical protein
MACKISFSSQSLKFPFVTVLFSLFWEEIRISAAGQRVGRDWVCFFADFGVAVWTGDALF